MKLQEVLNIENDWFYFLDKIYIFTRDQVFSELMKHSVKDDLKLNK